MGKHTHYIIKINTDFPSIIIIEHFLINHKHQFEYSVMGIITNTHDIIIYIRFNYPRDLDTVLKWFKPDEYCDFFNNMDNLSDKKIEPANSNAQHIVYNLCTYDRREIGEFKQNTQGKRSDLIKC